MKFGKDRHAGADDRADDRLVAENLDDVGARFVDQAPGGRHCGFGTGLNSARGHVATEQRTLDSATHRFACDEELIDRQF